MRGSLARLVRARGREGRTLDVPLPYTHGPLCAPLPSALHMALWAKGRPHPLARVRGMMIAHVRARGKTIADVRACG